MFFLKIIPVTVENIDGVINLDKFIFGGFYYTSLLYEIQVGNIFGTLSFLPLFIFIVANNYFLKNKKIKKDGTKSR